MPSRDLVHAFPLLDDNASLVRLAFQHSNLCASPGPAPRNETTAGRLHNGRSLRRVLLGVALVVTDIDESDHIDGRLGLGVKTMDSERANAEAREQCHADYV